MLSRITGYVIILTVILLLAYDLYAYLHGGVQATISFWVFTKSHEHLVIPFMAGLLAGHLFWQID